MKYKNEIVIISIIAILVLFLKVINVFQVENGLGYPFVMFSMIICFSFITIFIQKDIDKNYEINKLNYQNLNILKYISAILIVILHLRPFLNFSNELDLAFNNIVTRICVPIFFIITGYFVAKKEKDNEDYIKSYIKKTIPLYLTWSLLYVPVIIVTMIQHLPTINEYLAKNQYCFTFISCFDNIIVANCDLACFVLYGCLLSFMVFSCNNILAASFKEMEEKI